MSCLLWKIGNASNNDVIYAEPSLKWLLKLSQKMLQKEDVSSGENTLRNVELQVRNVRLFVGYRQLL